MASLQLVQTLILVTGCILVQVEVKADMTSEMMIKAIVREQRAELTKDHSMAESELKEMLRKVMESLNQLERKLDHMDNQLNQCHQDLNQIKQITLNGIPDCAELYNVGKRTSGLYTIRPQGGAGVKVYCDMVTDGGGWTVFQKRYSGDVDFYRGWEEYARGFGDLQGEHWLGLRTIHIMTKTQPNELYVGLTDFDLGAVYAKYGTFSISSEIPDKFRLTVGSYSGNASHSLTYSNGKKFSTKDQDNDISSRDCSKVRHGAWWYSDCSRSNLNGQFSPTKVSGYTYMAWKNLHDTFQSMKTSVMMMRPANFKP